MAAITSFTELKHAKTPGVRYYTMTASDGDTFTPPNITAIAAYASRLADPVTGNPIGCVTASGVITVNCTGLSSVSIIMTVVCSD